MARRKRRLSTGEAVARGALAGAAGGIALLAFDRVLAPRLGGEPLARERGWDRGIDRTLKRVGMRVPRKRLPLAGGAGVVVYGAVLGAAYGAIRGRMKLSTPAAGLLDAALVYAASLVSPELPPPRRTRRLSLQGKVMRQVNSPAVFRKAVAATWRALER